MFTDLLRGGLLRLPFEPLPGARALLVITAQQPMDRRALHVIQCGIDLVVIPMVDLRTGFLRGPSQRAERRQFIPRVDQGFNADIDDIGQDVFAAGRFQHRPHNYAPAPVAKRRNAEVVTDQRQVPLAKPTLLILLEAVVGE